MELVAIHDPLTLDIIESGCVTWEDLVRSVRNFKYGRNQHRGDFERVWYDRIGTCSTKHGFLYKVARTNGFVDVKLLVGIYLMTARNTPKVANLLAASGLRGIPEAHCYLKVGNGYLDATTSHSSYKDFSDDLLEEKMVEIDFLVNDKIAWHKAFLEVWLTNQEIDMMPEELWAVREECIQVLSD